MRLIDADALQRHGKRGGVVYWKDIKEAPKIDAEPVRHGKWEVAGDTTHYYICSVCGKPGDFSDNYCRSCGAEMGE